MPPNRINAGWSPPGTHADSTQHRYDLKRGWLKPGETVTDRGLQWVGHGQGGGFDPSRQDAAWHAVVSPKGTPAPIGVINYTPATGEVHAHGAQAPVNEDNISLMPLDAFSFDDKGVGTGQTAFPDWDQQIEGGGGQGNGPWDTGIGGWYADADGNMFVDGGGGKLVPFPGSKYNWGTGQVISSNGNVQSGGRIEPSLAPQPGPAAPTATTQQTTPAAAPAQTQQQQPGAIDIFQGSTGATKPPPAITINGHKMVLREDGDRYNRADWEDWGPVSAQKPPGAPPTRSYGGTVYQYDPTTGSYTIPLGPSTAPRQPPAESWGAITKGPDGRPLRVSNRGRIWDLSTGQVYEGPGQPQGGQPGVQPPGTTGAQGGSQLGGLPGVAQYMAQQYGLNPDIFLRQIAQESGWNPNAGSGAGARGIAQFMPGTGNYAAKLIGVTPEQFWADPALQLQGAAALMSQYLTKYQGDYRLALIAYNAGEGTADANVGRPDPRIPAETQSYLSIILGGSESHAPIPGLGNAEIAGGGGAGGFPSFGGKARRTQVVQGADGRDRLIDMDTGQVLSELPGGASMDPSLKPIQVGNRIVKLNPQTGQYDVVYEGPRQRHIQEVGGHLFSIDPETNQTASLYDTPGKPYIMGGDVFLPPDVGLRKVAYTGPSGFAQAEQNFEPRQKVGWDLPRWIGRGPGGSPQGAVPPSGTLPGWSDKGRDLNKPMIDYPFPEQPQPLENTYVDQPTDYGEMGLGQGRRWKNPRRVGRGQYGGGDDLAILRENGYSPDDYLDDNTLDTMLGPGGPSPYGQTNSGGELWPPDPPYPQADDSDVWRPRAIDPGPQWDVAPPADTTVTRDDYRKTWAPTFYQDEPNAADFTTRPESAQVQPAWRGLNDALQLGHDVYQVSPYNPPNLASTRYAGFDTSSDRWGGFNPWPTPERPSIGVNAQDPIDFHLRNEWLTTGRRPGSDETLRVIAGDLSKILAHEESHNTVIQHGPIQDALIRKLRSGPLAQPSEDIIFESLRAMRNSGYLDRAIQTAVSGNQTQPRDPGPQPQPRWVGGGQASGAPISPIDPEQVVGGGNKFGQQVSMEGTHHGTDLQAYEGTPVVSPVSGVVVKVDSDPQGLGLQVHIQGEDGSTYTVAHLLATSVQEGDRVEQGQLIAHVGESGAGATGPHLDYRIQDQQGNWKNPEPQLGALGNLPEAPNTVQEGEQPGTGQDSMEDWWKQNARPGVFGQQSGIQPPGELPWADLPSRIGGAMEHLGVGNLSGFGSASTWGEAGSLLPRFLFDPDHNSDMEWRRPPGQGQGRWVGKGQFGVDYTPNDLSGLYNSFDWGGSNDGGGGGGGGGGGNDNIHTDTGPTIYQQEQLAQSQEQIDNQKQQIENQAHAEAQRHQEAMASAKNDAARIKEQARHDKAMEQLQQKQLDLQKQEGQLKAYSDAMNRNAQYRIQGTFGQQQQAKLLQSALTNPWLQALTGMAPGYGLPGWNANQGGGVLQSLLNGWNPQQTPDFSYLEPVPRAPKWVKFSGNGAQQGYGVQGGGAQGSQPGRNAAGGNPIDAVLGNPTTAAWSQAGYGGYAPLGSAPPTPAYKQWQRMSPFERASWRTLEESAQPFPAAVQQTRENWADQGVFNAPNTARFSATQMDPLGIMGQNQTAEMFGESPQNYWKGQEKTWAQAAAPSITQVD